MQKLINNKLQTDERTKMVTILRIYLRRKQEAKWFIDIANKVREFNSIWESSEGGYVWKHKQHGGKVRFMIRTVRGADEVRAWHPSGRNRFLQAQATADFIQWVHYNAGDYVRRILVFIPA